MDEQGILVDQLEDLDVDITHISPSHHFPNWYYYACVSPLRITWLGK